MKRLIVLLLGIVCIGMLGGCGIAYNIDGKWVPEIQSNKINIRSIQFIKEDTYRYKGIVTFKNGKTKTSMFTYDHNVNGILEDASDVKKHEAEGIPGGIGLLFNKTQTKANLGNTGSPAYIFVKDYSIE